jgi:hypothetical protein
MSGPSVLDHLGPYTRDEPVQALCILSQKTWEQFLSVTGEVPRDDEYWRHYFAPRMMCISEIMSRAIRVNASWALTHAAMSLLRDRYEQTVRFSWFTRQLDSKELEKYMLHFYSKTRAILRSVPVETRKRYEKIMDPVPAWATAEFTKEQREKMRQWEGLDLRTMATKRDALPEITELPIGRENLAQWYNSIYAQFSSVAHFDMYSIEMLDLHAAPDGRVVLAAGPHWPALLVLQKLSLRLGSMLRGDARLLRLESRDRVQQAAYGMAADSTQIESQSRTTKQGWQAIS